MCHQMNSSLTNMQHEYDVYRFFVFLNSLNIGAHAYGAEILLLSMCVFWPEPIVSQQRMFFLKFC